MAQAKFLEDSETPIALDEGEITSRDGTRLYWRSAVPRAEPARARVVVVHGYGDHSGRYREVLQRLAIAGYAVHAFDLRGHGMSAGRRTHCARFGEYLEDLDAMMAFVRGERPLFLLGHSLGGLIAGTWVLERRPALAGLVLVAPYLGLAFQPAAHLLFVARLLDRVVPWARLPNGLKVEQLTRDLDVQRATERDPLYRRSATPRWFFETLRAQERLLRGAAELTLPTRVVAGSVDPIADLAVTRRFFDALGPSDKTLRIYPDMLHEPLNEVGREQVYADLVAWLAAHL